MTMPTCTDIDLAGIFREQADWRLRKAFKQRDDDAGNRHLLQVADRFEELAGSASSVPTQMMEADRELYDDDIRAAELFTELLQQVGSRWQPEDALEFVQTFIARATNP